MSTHEQRVAEIRERLEAATPGPWEYNGYSAIWAFRLPLNSPYDEDGEGCGQIASVWDPASHQGSGDLARHPQTRANADLIAHAPGDLAYLLDRLERAEMALRHAIRALEEGRIPHGGDFIADLRRALDTPEPETEP